MSANQKLHQLRLQEWSARFSDQKNSGLPVRQWCEQNNISYHAYNYWKHSLKETVVDQVLPEIVPLQFPSSENPLPPASDRIRANRANSTDHTNSVPVRLTIGELLIETDSSVPEAFLISLIKAARYAERC